MKTTREAWEAMRDVLGPLESPMIVERWTKDGRRFYLDGDAAALYRHRRWLVDGGARGETVNALLDWDMRFASATGRTLHQVWRLMVGAAEPEVK